MGKALIVFFSVGGTTAQVADSIAAGLGDTGYEVEHYNLKDGRPPDPTGYDLFGVGSPTYYYRLPFNVEDYLADLPQLGGLPAFAFVLQGTYRGDAGNHLRAGLARRGVREVGFFASYGADAYLGYLQQGYLFWPDSPTAEELTRAAAFGRKVAAVATCGAYTKPPVDPAPALIFRFERLIAHRWLIENLYSRLFTVKRDLCTACGVCRVACPTGNISEDANGHPVWGRNCLFCLNCEMKCPTDAITSASSWPLMLPFMIYNTRRAARDPALTYVRVAHRRGRTTRV